MSLRNSIFFLLVSLSILSCDKKRVFDDYKSVGNEWKRDSIVSFEFEHTDTIKPYNLFVNIRNNKDYEFSNLFLIVAMEHPDGLTKVDTLEYEMANPDGTLMGEGFTDVKDNKLFYKEKVRFPAKGNYKVFIRHAVRKTGKIAGVDDLKGVTDVGFRVEAIE
jgi:gliding motility-associated lipoprotein GldH